MACDKKRRLKGEDQLGMVLDRVTGLGMEKRAVRFNDF